MLCSKSSHPYLITLKLPTLWQKSLLILSMGSKLLGWSQQQMTELMNCSIIVISLIIWSATHFTGLRCFCFLKIIQRNLQIFFSFSSRRLSSKSYYFLLKMKEFVFWNSLKLILKLKFEIFMQLFNVFDTHLSTIQQATWGQWLCLTFCKCQNTKNKMRNDISRKYYE